MSRSEHRGASFLAQGEDVIAAAQDRRTRPGATDVEVERDWSTREGATELAQRIVRFWRDEFGATVECRVVPTGFGTFGVRSGLVRGVPR